MTDVPGKIGELIRELEDSRMSDSGVSEGNLSFHLDQLKEVKSEVQKMQDEIDNKDGEIDELNTKVDELQERVVELEEANR